MLHISFFIRRTVVAKYPTLEVARSETVQHVLFIVYAFTPCSVRLPSTSYATDVTWQDDDSD